MRLRMGCFVGEGATQGGVRWEASDARCFAFGKRGAECGEACKMVTMVAVKRKETGEVAVWDAMNRWGLACRDDERVGDNDVLPAAVGN